MTPPRITLYSTRRCPHCSQAKQYLKRKGLRFKELDIEGDARARRAYERLGARGVPVILIGDQRVDGFDPKRIERLLKAATL